MSAAETRSLLLSPVNIIINSRNTPLFPAPLKNISLAVTLFPRSVTALLAAFPLTGNPLTERD